MPAASVWAEIFFFMLKKMTAQTEAAGKTEGMWIRSLIIKKKRRKATWYKLAK